MEELKISKRPKILCCPTELLFNPNIPESAKSLFGIFYLYKNKESCWANNAFLGLMACQEERTVTRNIKILNDWGYIKILNQGKTNKRRIKINNYEYIYSEISDFIYNNRRNPDKLGMKKIKEMFIDARNKSLEEKINEF